MAVINELVVIPLGTLIGSPLTAAVEAQAKAAMTTVDFINAVGFEEGTDNKAKKVKAVTFSSVNGPKG